MAYATIMLNTDLHRANMEKKKGSKKMTKDEFLNNLKGSDQGTVSSTEYVQNTVTLYSLKLTT